MEELFIAMVPVTLFLTIGGVLIFRPLTKRLGLMLEANAANKRADESDRIQYDHVRALLEAQTLKIEALEQRLEFTESLLETRTRRRYLRPGLEGASRPGLPDTLA
ncbi:MAG: hypothetical protein PVF05_11150 [Gemmatimonadales bacterium]|jgi:hypothetical protein